MNPGGARFFQILFALAVTEFKIRYFGSVLGYLWSLMRPLMLFGVLYVVFTHVVRFGGDIEHYPLKLLLAIVLWSYFAEATGQALDSLVERESLLRKVPFPPAVDPAVGRCSRRAFNFGPEPVRRARVRARHGHRAGGLAGWSSCRSCAGSLVLTAAVSMLLAVLYVPVPGHGADLGGRHAAAVLGHADHLRDRDGAGERARAADDEPARGDHRAGAARRDRPVGAHARPRPIGGAALLLIPLGITAVLLVASVVLYRRAAATLAERL